MQGGVLLLGIVNEHARVIGCHYHDTRNEGLRIDFHSQTFVFVRTEDHLLAVLEHDRVLGTLFAVSYPSVSAVVENHAVNQALNHRCPLVGMCLFHAVNGGRHIYIQRAGEERAACA